MCCPQSSIAPGRQHIFPAHLLGPDSASLNLRAILQRFAWRRPAVSAAPPVGRQPQTQVSIPAVADWSSDLRLPTLSAFGDFFIPGSSGDGGVSLNDRKT